MRDDEGSTRTADTTVRIGGDTLRLPVPVPVPVPGGVVVRCMRTLRLPERGTHDLPSGLGVFPSGGFPTTPAPCPPSARRVADECPPSG